MTTNPFDMPELTTARLRIRRLREDDIDLCHALFVDVGWTDSSATDAENRDRRARWLAWTVMNYEQLASLYQPPYGERGIELAGTGELVGLVGLVPSFAAFGELAPFGGAAASPNSAEVGLFWMLSPRHQGNGYATEAARRLAEFAFEVLRVGRLVATTQHDNPRSVAVMRRLGMRIETTEHTAVSALQVVGVMTPGGVGSEPGAPCSD